MIPFLKTKKFSYEDAMKHITKSKKGYNKLYHEKGMTAREVATRMNIAYNNDFQKALLRVCGNKDMGQGGKRKGSGNKKGWNKA